MVEGMLEGKNVMHQILNILTQLATINDFESKNTYVGLTSNLTSLSSHNTSDMIANKTENTTSLDVYTGDRNAMSRSLQVSPSHVIQFIMCSSISLISWILQQITDITHIKYNDNHCNNN